MLSSLSHGLALLAVVFAATESSSEITQLTPQRIILSSRRAPPGSSFQRRALSPVNVPLADFFLGTDLQWFGNISVGTPPQPLTVVFDTGSSSLEFASTLCTTCPQTKFNSSKSSTFVDGGRTSSITFSTGVGVDPVIGSNYKLTLRSAVDSVTVGGLKAPNVNLFLITAQTPKFDIDPFSGIQGMAATASGFFAGLISQGLPAVFSMFLTPNSAGKVAELTLGGIDTTQFTGPLTYASLASATSSTWSLRSPQLSVNGKTTTVLKASRNIIFDSGTSNILFSTSTTEALYSLISPAIKPHTSEPGTYGIACSLIPTLPAVIDITFTSQAGTPFNLTIPSSELSVGPFADNATECQTLINAFDGLDLVGGSVFKHYTVVHDVGAHRMGFAKTGKFLYDPLKLYAIMLTL